MIHPHERYNVQRGASRQTKTANNQLGLPQSMMVTQLNDMRTASGVNREVFSEVWQKYDVGLCVTTLCF
jgi:hypothetical protein